MTPLNVKSKVKVAADDTEGQRHVTALELNKVAGVCSGLPPPENRHHEEVEFRKFEPKIVSITGWKMRRRLGVEESTRGRRTKAIEA